MKKINILILTAFFLTAFPLGAEQIAPQKKVTPPKKIEYDEKILVYEPSWQDREIYLEANIDEDPELEIIIGFITVYKPETERKNEDVVPFSVNKKIFAPVENYVFYQIYDEGRDGRYKIVKTLPGMDRLGKVEIFKITENGPPAIAIFSPGGESYIDLAVYQWKEGGFKLIFSQGTSKNIAIDTSKTTPEIHIGDDIFIWKNGFEKRS